MFYMRRSAHKRTLHILWWTLAVCLQGVGCKSWSRGCTLYRDAPRAAYMLDLPPWRMCGDLEIEGGVNVSLWKCGILHGTIIWSGVWMSLLDKQEVQDICEHTALRARKWSGFICKRVWHYRTRSTEESSEVRERLSLELVTECFHKLE